MKLLFVSNLFPDTAEPYRGLDNACLLHSLSRDCEIRVIATRPGLPFKKDSPKACREIDRKFQPQYLKTLYVPKVGSRFNHHLFARAIREPLLSLKKDFEYDIILCAWLFPDATAVALLQTELKVPFVAIAQGSDAHAYLRMPARRRIIVDAMNRSSGVITRSAKLTQLLEEAGVEQGKAQPVYNGVDLELFCPGDKQAEKKALGLPNTPLILFIGNFVPVKNPLLLIQAHAQLCEQVPSTLVMIGGGPMEGEAREFANKAGFGNDVILAGRKSSAEIARYMRAADVLCLSSENEGVPNVILEAFASGVPVVSTNVGGIAEVVNSEFLGTLVERGNAKELSSALAKTLLAKPAVEKIRAHGLTFSWERSARQYLEILRNAVRK
ncbi:MAG: hypothetical protein JWM68_1593 [Verrucomicrobiales bacterium]|nr:hypothetical protein [Verrucomicrobiales bacterium]